MKIRQDAWTEENDLLLAETILRHVREGSTQLNAFEEVGDKLNRTSAACGFRWNAVVRHQYEQALQLAKKQRKQRQRLLGGVPVSKKKALYQPPTIEMEAADTFSSVLSQPEMNNANADEAFSVELGIPHEVVKKPYPVVAQTVVDHAPTLDLHTVIMFLQQLNQTQHQTSGLKRENERLTLDTNELIKENETLRKKVATLEQNTETIKEDYETLMKIMNRARKLVLFEEEDLSAPSFKMDRNGNLEKLAE